MKGSKTSTGNYKNRLQELQDKFRQLEPEIKDSGTKEALSLVNGMVQEVWRHVDDLSHGRADEGISLKRIAEMYRNAPRMEGQALNTPLPVGKQAPEFSLKDANGNLVSLSDFSGSTVLLVFYPLDWSPGCSQQLDLYQNEADEFEKRKVKIAGISVDSIYSHGAWAAVRKIEFPLLSDFNPKGEVSAMYNVYRNSDGFSERALYLVDAEGVIRYSYVSPQIHHIPDIYQLLSKLEEIYKPAITI